MVYFSEWTYILEEAILKLAKLPLKRHSATNEQKFLDICENRELCPTRCPHTGPVSPGASVVPLTTSGYFNTVCWKRDPGCTSISSTVLCTAWWSRWQMRKDTATLWGPRGTIRPLHPSRSPGPGSSRSKAIGLQQPQAWSATPRSEEIFSWRL